MDWATFEELWAKLWEYLYKFFYKLTEGKFGSEDGAAPTDAAE